MDLNNLYTTVKEKIMPVYSQQGDILAIYAKGSLVSGYTDNSDLDLTFVWKNNFTVNREELIKKIDGSDYLSTVDYETVHNDRFVLENQEFNIGHISEEQLKKYIDEVMSGEGFLTNQIIEPLIFVSGLYYGVILIDDFKLIENSRKKLGNFPNRLIENTKIVFNSRKGNYLQHLKIFAERKDYFAFNKELVDSIYIFLITWFSLNKIYYPGDKWIAKSIEKHKLNSEVGQIIDNIFKEIDFKNRLELLDRLFRKI